MTAHHRGHLENGSVKKDEMLSAPAWVEIQPGDGAFYLLHMALLTLGTRHFRKRKHKRTVSSASRRASGKRTAS